MGTTFGERLAVLQKKFTEAEHRFAGLKLDLLAPWASTAEPMTHKRWKAFLRAKVEGASPDTIWDPFPDGRFLGRFSGNLEGLQEFEEITREAYLLFCEIDPTLHRKTDYRGWLHIIHDIAYYCPTTDVDIEVRLWGYRRVSGAKKPMVFSSGVVRSYPMDFVDLVRLENIKVKVSPGWGYLVEAAIPLATLGLRPAEGLVLRGDFGVTHGDRAGARTRLRSYWANQHTGIVDDAVFELKMQPRNWGELTFK